MTTENKNINIKGDETIKELVNKVNQVDSLKEKIGVCIMVISFIEIRNGYRPGSNRYIFKIGHSKEFPPKDPTDKERYVRVDDPEINDFLFYLKNSDYDCFSMLVDKFYEIGKKKERKENLITYSVVGVIILLIIYFWNNPIF